MRSVQFGRYGPPDVLEINDVETPAPGPDQVLVRVAAAAINPKDCLVRKGKFRLITGKRFPQTLGQDFAGQVESLGAGVTGLHPNERVFGMVNRWTGGAYAEFIAAPASELARMPENLSYEQAAAMPLAAQTALQALRDLADVRAGEKVLINGASGGVGSFAIQIAKILGAQVTAVCSDANTELVLGLGADETVDYRSQDPLTLPNQYDVFFDVFGNKDFSRSRHLLANRGRYIQTVPNLKNAGWHIVTRLLPGRRGLLVVVRSRRADLQTLAGWVDAGKLHPLVDHSCRLDEVVDAHRHVETKRARGKVILVL